MFDWFFNEWLASTDTSQADVVRLTGYPKAKVSDLSTGKQRYNRDILNDVAKALNINPHELLMHPEDAMALRQMRSAMQKFVKIPVAGTAIDETPKTRRKAG